MASPQRSSAEAFEQLIPGELLAEYSAQSAADVLIQVLSRQLRQDSIIIPAVPEPLLVWILAGQARVGERPIGGQWVANTVRAGDFFLTTAAEPTELRWHADDSQPFKVMHLYLGLQLLTRVVREIHGKSLAGFALREVSGARDEALSTVLGLMHAELSAQQRISATAIQGLAQALSVHLVRTYPAQAAARKTVKGGLPVYKLRRIVDLMKANLATPFHLGELAAVAELSDYHFSRVFRQTTGLSPSRYFIRLRMQLAKRLLRESGAAIIDIGMAVGYSSPSHFSQVFRKETGLTPGAYRA
jgi:AraC family transcriptional regulator